MIPDPYRRTVRIPVRISQGSVTLLDGGRLPRLKDGAIGDLVLDADTVQDSEFLRLLQAESTVEMLPSGTPVLMGVGLGVVPAEKQSKLKTSSGLRSHADYGFVEVCLTEPLRLRLRGTKDPMLEPCACRIPIVGKRNAISLNHAFTVISTEFETERKSHTGNVFERGFVKWGKNWLSLGELRDLIRVRFEQEE